MKIISEVKDGQIMIRMDKERYKNDAVKRVAISLENQFSFKVEHFDEKTVGVYFLPKLMMPDEELTAAAFYLCSEISLKTDAIKYITDTDI